MNRSITGQKAQQLAELQDQDLALAQLIDALEPGQTPPPATRVRELQRSRAALLAEIPEPWRSQYERITARYGRALVPAQRQTCLGCYARVPYAAMPRVRTALTISRCESCGRLLLWPADRADGAEHSS